MISAAWRANRQRTRLGGRVPDGPLREYLAVPLPGRDTPLPELPLLAVDLETTGLSPARDRIVAAGFVPVDGDGVDLSGARRIVVHSTDDVGQSATVHGLTDDTIAAGVPLRTALEAVLVALRGRVLLAHYAVIEQGFLSAACRQEFGHRLPAVVVDTLQIQRRIASTPWTDPRGGSVRLPAARAAYGLPRYRSHEALTDALACAELYLAQTAFLAERGRRHLRHVLG